MNILERLRENESPIRITDVMCEFFIDHDNDVPRGLVIQDQKIELKWQAEIYIRKSFIELSLRVEHQTIEVNAWMADEEGEPIDLNDIPMFLEINEDTKITIHEPVFSDYGSVIIEPQKVTFWGSLGSELRAREIEIDF